MPKKQASHNYVPQCNSNKQDSENKLRIPSVPVTLLEYLMIASLILYTGIAVLIFPKIIPKIGLNAMDYLFLLGLVFIIVFFVTAIRLWASFPITVLFTITREFQGVKLMLDAIFLKHLAPAPQYKTTSIQ
ncbi:MAG: hypothetical protein AB1538_02785 [Bacillota bacterium]